MEMNQNKLEINPSQKTHRSYLITQFLLRSLTFAASLIATVMMVTNKQTVEVYGFLVVVKFNDSPFLSFLVGGNAIASCYALLSLPSVFIINSKRLNSSSYFFLFLFDLIIMGLVLAASSAATAISYVGKKGNSSAGWAPICDHVAKFCEKSAAALACSYASFVLLFLLVIFSANRPRQVAIASSY